MKFKFAGLSVALMALAAYLSPTSAADMDNRGMRGTASDYGSGAVPVPAPIPYEENYQWYVSTGIGQSLRSSGNVSATGGVEMSPLSDLTGPTAVSLAIGRYITPTLRVEFGVDFRLQQKVGSGGGSYKTTLYAAGDAKTVTNALGTTIYSGPSQNYNIYNVTHSEEDHTQTHTFMLNTYHEFMRAGALRPYIGAGVGLALHMLNRSYTERAVCDGTNGSRGGNDIVDTFGLTRIDTCWNNANLPSTKVTQDSQNASGVGLAAAAMAGVTYDMTRRTHLDVGYRMMWQGGKVAASGDGINGVSRVEIGSRLDHELRAAVRFDLW